MRYLFTFLCFFFFLTSQAQGILVGKVIDQSGEALVGASVIIHETEDGITTDLEGKFEFRGLKTATYHLHVSYIGYQAKTLEVKVNGGKPIIVTLEPTSLELSEVVIESNHYKTGPKEHTLAMEVVDMEFMNKNSDGTLVNTLERLPGVSAIKTGVGISKPVIRGMSFNRVIVNDRGVKQEGQQWGTDHGLELDMFDPGRVEVIKGPGSLMYGSDGLGGVLNVFPAKLPSLNEHNGSFQSVYRTNNQSIATSMMLEGNHNHKVYRFRFSTQDFGDYRVPANSFTYNNFQLNLFDQQLKNTAGRERNFSGMVGIKKNWGYTTLTVSNFHQQAGFFVGAIGIPRSYQLTPDGDSRDIQLPKQIINHFKIISNTNVLIANNWLELDIGYQNNDREERSLPHAHGKGPRPEGTLAHALKLQTYSVNARYYVKKSESRSRIFGFQGQIQQNDRAGFEFLLPTFTTSSAGVFLFEEISLSNELNITAGARYDFANRQIDSYEEPIYSNETTIARYYQRNGDINADFNNFSGAVGASYYPNRSFNLKWNLGTSFKVPTAAELSMNGIHHGTFRHEFGDSTLTSERGVQADVSLSIQKSNFSLMASPFVSWFNGFIYLAPTSRFSSSLDDDAFPEGGQVFQYRQHDAFFAGGEFSVEYHPVEPLHIRTAFEYVYNYNFDTRLPLPFTPPASVLSEIDYEFNTQANWVSNLAFGINHRWVADQNRVDRNEFKTPGYQLFGLNASAEFNINGLAAVLNLSVQNLMDTRYFNHLSRYRLLNLPEQGRNIVISLRIPFAIQY